MCVIGHGVPGTQIYVCPPTGHVGQSSGWREKHSLGFLFN